MATTDVDVVNQAIFLIGDDQTPVTGVSPTFDNSAAGKAAQQLYVPCVQTVARQFGWDFSRNTVTLVATGNTAPTPWAYEYAYPTMGVEVRQLLPPPPIDPNNPLPQRWDVANVLVGSTPTKVIHTNLANASTVFTNFPPPTLWDPLFREAVVRLLASEFAIALGGKPDTAQSTLQSAATFEKLGEERRD